MLGTRIKTGAVLIGGLFLIFFIDQNWLYRSLLFMISVFAGYEYFSMFQTERSIVMKRLIVALGLLFSYYFLNCHGIPISSYLFLFVLINTVYYLIHTGNLENNFKSIAHSTFGFFYTMVLPASLLTIFLQPQGRWLIVFLIFVIALNDTGGYFCGKTLGKHKLNPAISPGKTVEGLVGGVATAAIGGFLFAWLVVESLPVRWPVFTAIILALTGVAGDLLESMLKRVAGVKDSGRFLPGHGGVLDRIDGYLLAGPLFAIYLEYCSICS